MKYSLKSDTLSLSLARRLGIACTLLAGMAGLPEADGAASAAVFPQRLLQDRVEPHWFDDNRQFWYRVDRPAGSREFVVVDAEAGTRKPAFDHAGLAQSLTLLLGREFRADRLPAASLVFLPDGKGIELELEDGSRVGIHPENGKPTLLAESGNPGIAGLFLPPRPSTDRGGEISLTLENRLAKPVQMVWIDRGGIRHPYQTVPAGESVSQHTFAGHVWLVQYGPEEPVGCFEAADSAARIVIDAAVAGAVKQESPRARGAARRPGRGQNRTIRPPSGPARSPFGEYEVMVETDNLALRILKAGLETEGAGSVLLTHDATSENSFRRDASRARLVSMQFGLADFPADVPDAHWSPGSEYVLAFQTTRVPERRVHYVESLPEDGIEPKLQSYPYAKPGDPLPERRPRLFRIADRVEIPVSDELFPDPFELRFLRWNSAGDRAWLLYNERGHQRLKVLELELATGKVRAVVDESSDTFIHYSSPGKFEIRWQADNQLLWASERSGWNHLYRYDLESGTLLNAVTRGEWNVKRIESVDGEAGVVWFYAVGVLPGQDPYHEHFCRVNFDGSGFQVLTAGDGTHAIEWSPDRRWFFDRWSRVDLPPVTELRDSRDGTLSCELEKGVVEQAGGSGNRPWTGPERFVARGRDGVTDIWGIVHWPADLDPAGSLPVIENIYAGPHDQHVPKSFQLRHGNLKQLTDAGFAVVQIDGMGTAWRSKAFHDVCWRNLRDAGFPDRIAWLKALAAKYPQLDLERVGIYGGSAGGQNAMAALLWHGDFYRAAVADCGCHDNRMDKLWWNEQWMGIPGEGTHYAENSNMENAARLQGHLLLVAGELDRNVDPATTTQVVGKLIRANRDFEFLLMVGVGHGACETAYGSRKRLEFFQKHLGGPLTRSSGSSAPKQQ